MCVCVCRCGGGGQSVCSKCSSALGGFGRGGGVVGWAVVSLRRVSCTTLAGDACRPPSTGIILNKGGASGWRMEACPVVMMPSPPPPPPPPHPRPAPSVSSAGALAGLPCPLGCCPVLSCHPDPHAGTLPAPIQARTDPGTNAQLPSRRDDPSTATLWMAAPLWA